MLAFLAPVVTFLGKPLVKWGLIAGGVVALVLGVLWYIDGVRAEGKKAGAAEVTGQVQSNTIVIQREIQRAEDRGPRTPRDVSKRLRDGSF